MFLRKSGKQNLKRRIGAWTGMVALSVHIFLALAQFTPTKGMADAAPGMSEFLVICVAYGNQDDGDADKKKNGGTPSCPVCLAKVLAGGLVPVNTAEIASFPTVVRLVLTQYYIEPVRQHGAAHLNSRAPPFFA